MKTIAVDFDRVVHSDLSSSIFISKDYMVVPDKPVEFSIEWLRYLMKSFHVIIYSARLKKFGAKYSIQQWLAENGLKKEEIEKLQFVEKPDAHLYIDDR